MSRPTPFLWFDTHAEEAANFYVSVFDNSKLGKVTRYGDSGPGPAGKVMTVEFTLDGQPFLALNGGPQFKFTEAVSFSVPCETQEEIDKYWGKLSDGGQEGPCGWLKDKYGLSWQINPTVLGKMLGDPDRAKANRAMQAMLGMKKMDIAALKNAYDG
jgi:predicted 3-demethylubiquinone-9 3-methyltransferase (glyoxalase superfamily)